MPEPEICFVICPIGDEDTEIRKCSDIVLKEIISPATNSFGYEIKRADHLSHPGMITSQIIDMLAEAPLVIADLSDGNPNVFYELAIRHVVGLPCIQLIKSGQRIPFDTSGMRTILYDLRVDLAHRAMDELKQQISSVKEGTYKPDNPVLSAKRYEAIKSKIFSTDNADLRDLFSELMDSMKSSIDEMRREIAGLKQTNQKEDLDTLNSLAKLNSLVFYHNTSKLSRFCTHDRIEKIKEAMAHYQKRLDTESSLSEKERIDLAEKIMFLQDFLKQQESEDRE